MRLAEQYLLACYYRVKPLIPRWLQIRTRSWLISRKMPKYTSVWPIDAFAAERPLNWSGWPNGNRFALILTHDVDTARGRDRCDRLASLEEELGFRSSFNFVCEDYLLPAELRNNLTERGFEVGVHGITHRGNPFRSRSIFSDQAARINRYLEQWGSVGFRCPSMYHNLDWIGELAVKYDSSTFDTDPFEPQPEGVRTIFPFLVSRDSTPERYVELPYTLPQDFTLFILMRHTDIDIWKRKVDWIAECGGMALINCHPDYMVFGGQRRSVEEYPAEYYEKFLEYVRDKHSGRYWHVLPKAMAAYIYGSRGVTNRQIA